MGYGSSPDDVSTIPPWFRPYVTAHVLLSTSLFGALLTFAASLRGARAASLRRQNIDGLELTEGLIGDLDRNGDGVDKLEFVIGMLAKLDMVYWHDVQPLLKLFDRFDLDKSGVLTKDDIVLQLRGDGGSRAAAATPDLSASAGYYGLKEAVSQGQHCIADVRPRVERTPPPTRCAPYDYDGAAPAPLAVNGPWNGGFRNDDMIPKTTFRL